MTRTGVAYNHTCSRLCLATAQCRYYSHYACEPSGKVCTAAGGVCQLCSTLGRCSAAAGLATFQRVHHATAVSRPPSTATPAATATDAEGIPDTTAPLPAPLPPTTTTTTAEDPEAVYVSAAVSFPYTMVHGAADCCCGNTDVPPLWVGAVGTAPSPADCEPLCALAKCHTFSYQQPRGQCCICAASERCKLTASAAHSTWRSETQLNPPCAAAALSASSLPSSRRPSGERTEAHAEPPPRRFVLIANHAASSGANVQVEEAPPRDTRVVRFNHMQQRNALGGRTDMLFVRAGRNSAATMLSERPFMFGQARARASAPSDSTSSVRGVRAGVQFLIAARVAGMCHIACAPLVC
jgi:hypothetical protein